jgi:hypothetical protein
MQLWRIHFACRHRDLAQCREEVDCVSVVSLPELIPSDWRETVSDVGDLACQIVANILNAYVNVKIETWKPDKVSVTRIRDAMWQIGDWSVVFSVQADELPSTPPALAAEKPTAKRDAPAVNSEQFPPPTVAATTPTATPVASAGKRKKSTTRGDGKTKLLVALALHHKYSPSGCLNLEPIGCNEIANLIVVSGSTASLFFARNFGDCLGYTAICRDAKKLFEILKSLYDEYADPSYGSEPM